MEQWLHRRMTRILGNARAVITELEHEGAASDQLKLIYNGVDIPRLKDPEEIKLIKDQLNVVESDMIITIVANLIPYKGHSDLLQALGGYQSELPVNWVLLCVGSDTHGIQRDLQEQAEMLGISGHVIFTGVRTDVHDILQASDLAVLCSHQEGFSNAVLEAMAAKLPLVVTNVGGNAEAVRDGVDGFVVPPRSVGRLGESIVKLARDSNLRRKMGRSARSRVESSFSMSICIKNYENVYDEILSK